MFQLVERGNRMRLLWAWPNADMTCQQRGHLLFCELLAKQGVAVTILTNETPGNRDVGSFWKGLVPLIKSSAGRWKWWGKAGLALRLLYPRLPADLVMMLPWFHWVKTAILAKKLYGRPYAVWLDTYTYAPQKTLWDRIYHEIRYGILLKNADLIIAESPDCYRIAASRLPRLRVVHIPMSLNMQRFRELETKWDADSNKPARAPVVLFVGRISPEKGPDLLVDAFSKVAHEFPEWKLKLVGPVAHEIQEWILRSVGLVLDKDYSKEVLGKAQAAGLQDRVQHLPGLYGEDLYRAYAESSVYVLPSLWEGVPTTILEAMYFGGAIISSRVGIVPYQLDDGRCGILVEPGDAESLASALRRLMKSEAEQCRLMQNARQRVTKTFSWERNIQTLEAEMRRILTCRHN